MDRSASYRRALAPTTLTTGIIGMLASWIGWYTKLGSPHGFIQYWLLTATLTLVIALLMIRRQAWKKVEPFWSLPTRRIADAMYPPFTLGLIISIAALMLDTLSAKAAWCLPPLWIGLYGCGLYAAGFFMPRGIKLFGMGFIVTGCLSLLGTANQSNLNELPELQHAHLVMGGAFGVFHLAYGIYLYLTENRDL